MTKGFSFIKKFLNLSINPIELLLNPFPFSTSQSPSPHLNLCRASCVYHTFTNSSIFNSSFFFPCHGQILKYYYSSATAKLLSAKLHINRSKPENLFVVTSESLKCIKSAPTILRQKS